MLKTIKFRSLTQKYIIKINKKHLKKKSLLKTKIEGLKNFSGRNNTGKITTFHKGGGHKHNYRKIDFFRKINSIGVVLSIEYDPNRTAIIASIYNFLQKNYYYMIAPKNLSIGDIIKSGPNAQISVGHSLPLAKIPEGSLIHNVSYKINDFSKISRAAGTFALLMEKTSNFCKIKLPSGKLKKLSNKCYATIGIVSDKFHYSKPVKKAGRSRWLNTRPTVRGVAMNPVDHPHGGGEGRKSGKGLTPWGKFNKRGKTGNSKSIL